MWFWQIPYFWIFWMPAPAQDAFTAGNSHHMQPSWAQLSPVEMKSSQVAKWVAGSLYGAYGASCFVPKGYWTWTNPGLSLLYLLDLLLSNAATVANIRGIENEQNFMWILPVPRALHFWRTVSWSCSKIVRTGRWVLSRYTARVEDTCLQRAWLHLIALAQPPRFEHW